MSQWEQRFGMTIASAQDGGLPRQLFTRAESVKAATDLLVLLDVEADLQVLPVDVREWRLRWISTTQTALLLDLWDALPELIDRCGEHLQEFLSRYQRGNDG